MSSGGKSGSSQKTLNHYFTIAGTICRGPLDWLTAVISNGNYIWQCPGDGPLDLMADGVVNSDGYVDLTGGILDPSLLMEGGFVHLYPRRPTANPSAALPGHGAYRDRAYMVARHIFFGQTSGSAPNVLVIGGHIPRVPTSIVAAADNIADDRQINPIAFLAEYMLDEGGGAMTEQELDAPSWLASAHWCAQDQAHRDYCFVSPLISEQMATRDVVRRLLGPVNGFLRRTREGKLGCYIYEWGVDPGALLTLDARHWSKAPKFTDGDWKDIPTEYAVSFTDRAYEFQENTVVVSNQRAERIRQTTDQAKLDRVDVTRAKQAFAHGLEFQRRKGSAPGTATLYVRGPIVAAVQPGDKIKVDTDPEPGGAGAAQLARVDKIKRNQGDETVLEVTLDPLVPASAYTPAWVSPLPEELFAGAKQTSPSIAHFQPIPLPVDYFGWPPAVGFLATRPSPQVSGFNAYFTSAALQPYTKLGSQFGFSARCQLVTGVAAGTGTLRLQLLDGASGPDAYLAAETPGGNAADAQDNRLVAVLLALDGSGRVALDAAGQPTMEFASIIQRSAITADTHDYTVYRGRCGLTAKAWAAGAVAWIVPIANLVEWRHDLFESMFGQPAYFRLGSFTSAAVDETNPLPQRDLVWPSIPVPNSLTAANGTGKAVDLDWTFSSETSFSGEYGVYRATGPGYSDWAKIGETSASRFTDHRVTLGVSYQYKIAAITPGEQASAYSNVVTITVAAVAGSDIDLTPPNDPGTPTLVGSGTYLDDVGGVHSYLLIRVPALPAAGGGKVAATLQELRWRISGTGATGWTIQDQPQNAGGTKDVRIDDLPPASQIEVELQSYSRFDVASTTAVTAAGSPFTAPVRTTVPTAPSTASLAADSTAPAVKGDLSGMMFGSRVTVTIPGDKDICLLEVKATFSNTDSAIDYTWFDYVSAAGLMTRAVRPGQTVSLSIYNGFASPGWVRARVRNTSGVASNWLYIGNANGYATMALGDVALQASGNMRSSGIAIASAGASSAKKVVTRYTLDTDACPTLVGGSAEEIVNISLSGRGFTTQPDTVSGLSVGFPPGLAARYDWDAAGNSSTNAVVKIRNELGGVVPAGPIRLMGEFVENY
ncbi:phage tail protein [Opitutus sp. ER46]|uniref:phage tail protein n=1 Tax=Opitutus sp. ER46 TaxID=2161864 RepID=UPI000D2FD384|nr:phage tail protein [Opitutus sp. ER46]PTX95778.1 hypothetical protein DB354_10225 [Opitutus sp. ER46]